MAQPMSALKEPLSNSNNRPIQKPPAIIPLNSLPPSFFMNQRIGPNSLINNLSTQSLPASFSIRNQDFPLQYNLPASNLPTRLSNAQPTFISSQPFQQLPINRTSSPEDDDDDVINDGDPRHKRRREMNRIAQQKSRQKKDQKIIDLQQENDQKSAKIIALEAEVKVWKNMTKKSENEANELRRKVEEIGEKYDRIKKQLKERNDFDINQIAAPVAIDRPTSKQKVEEMEEDNFNDGLQIDENDGQKPVPFEPKTEILEPEMSTNTKVIVESSSNPDTKMDMMQKEIESLQSELNRMYSLTNQQAETNKLLHQALADQEARFALKEAKIEDDSHLKLSSVQQTASLSSKNTFKIPSRWTKCRQGRITKRDIEKYKTIAKLMKLKGSASFLQ